MVDGCGFSAFLLNWLIAQQQQPPSPSPLRAAVSERGVLLLDRWAPPPSLKPPNDDDDEEGVEEAKEEEQPEEEEGGLLGGGGGAARPSKFVEVSGLGRAWVLARLLLRASPLPSVLGLGGCVTVVWSFTYDELEALKDAAMQPLAGTTNSPPSLLPGCLQLAWAHPPSVVHVAASFLLLAIRLWPLGVDEQCSGRPPVAHHLPRMGPGP